MKRIGNVWDDFCSVDLIKTAIMNAAKGKRKYRKVRKVLAIMPSSYTNCW